MRIRKPRWETTTLWILAALALGLRLYGLGYGLPSVLEEAVPFKRAWNMWGFGPLHDFDLNPHWFTYPSLVFYLQWVGQALTFALLRLLGMAHSELDLRVLYQIDKTAFYLVGRSLIALLGAATVFPTWSLAKRAAGTPAAVLAAAMVAIHPLLIAKSQVIDADTALTFFVTLSLALAAVLCERPTTGAILRAGAVMGLAASTKYPGLVMLLPMTLAIVWSRAVPLSKPPTPGSLHAAPPPPTGRPRRAARGDTRRAARARSDLAWPVRAALLIVAGAITFFLTSPYLFLEFRSARADLEVGRELMTVGHFGVPEGRAYGTYLRDWFTSLMGPPAGIAALVGLGHQAARRQPWALVILALFVPYVAVVGSWEMKAERYLLPLVPAGIVCAAALLGKVSVALPASRSPRAGRLALALGGMACVVPLALGLPAHWALRGTDTREQARRWIEDHLPAGSFIACEQLSPDLLSPLDLQSVDPDLVAALRRRGTMARLFAVQIIPMFVLTPERSAKFYRLESWRNADAILVTSSVRERYREDPTRFAPQLAFYDSLEAGWPRLAAFEPRGGPGPAMVLYRNPSVTGSFGARRAVSPPDTSLTLDPITGAEGFYYYNLALNHEAFGHVEQAQTSYLLALRFGGTEPIPYVHSAVRLAGTLWEEGRRGAAVSMLGQCAARAPGPRAAAELTRARAALLAGRSIVTPLRP